MSYALEDHSTLQDWRSAERDHHGGAPPGTPAPRNERRCAPPAWLWGGWPYRGVRLGEAAHPGPGLDDSSDQGHDPSITPDLEDSSGNIVFRF